jgi:hypothetical protein
LREEGREAFVYERTIDIDVYDRKRDRLREALTQMVRGTPPSSQNST